ncbi:MAG: hypothetical protein B6U97_04310, partial [Candidatus Altiarchaeales archaeon ex4484_96]
MENKKIREIMDKYPEFMLLMTIGAVLFIVYSSSVSGMQQATSLNQNISLAKTTASTIAVSATSTESIAKYSQCESYGGYCIHWQRECGEEYEASSYACSSKSDKCCLPGKDYVDVSITPEVDYVTVNEKAIYRIKITDK